LSDVVNKVQYDGTSAEGEPMVMLQLVPNGQKVRPPWKETRRWHALFMELAGKVRATADGGVYFRIAVSAPLVRIERAVMVVLESTKPPDKVGGLRTEDDRS